MFAGSLAAGRVDLDVKLGTRVKVRTYSICCSCEYCRFTARVTCRRLLGRWTVSQSGIKQALNVPKTNHLVNDQIRGSGKGTFDADAINIKSALTTPKPYSESDSQRNHQHLNMAGRFDASALHIQHGINGTKLQRNSKSDGRKIHEFLVSIR